MHYGLIWCKAVSSFCSSGKPLTQDCLSANVWSTARHNWLLLCSKHSLMRFLGLLMMSQHRCPTFWKSFEVSWIILCSFNLCDAKLSHQAATCQLKLQSFMKWKLSGLQELRDSFKFKNYISISRVFTDPSSTQDLPRSQKKQKVRPPFVYACTSQHWISLCIDLWKDLLFLWYRASPISIICLPKYGVSLTGLIIVISLSCLLIYCLQSDLKAEVR